MKSVPGQLRNRAATVMLSRGSLARHAIAGDRDLRADGLGQVKWWRWYRTSPGSRSRSATSEPVPVAAIMYPNSDGAFFKLMVSVFQSPTLIIAFALCSGHFAIRYAGGVTPAATARTVSEGAAPSSAEAQGTVDTSRPRARAAVPARTRFFIYLPLFLRSPMPRTRLTVYHHEPTWIVPRLHHMGLLSNPPEPVYTRHGRKHMQLVPHTRGSVVRINASCSPGLLSSMKRHGGRYSMTERTDTPASAPVTFSAVKESG